ncbi:MAG: hypothetical protein OXC46_03165 [Thaumarchaeota archaeon]|nr:hypothetical protein [Nitrososphaerota archaeon]
MTKVLKNKSWTITILTLLMGLLLPIINAQLPEDRQVSDDFADNLIYVALGIGAIGAGASATKRLRPNPVIVEDRKPEALATPKTPEKMSHAELVAMVEDLKKQAKG